MDSIGRRKGASRPYAPQTSCFCDWATVHETRMRRASQTRVKRDVPTPLGTQAPSSVGTPCGLSTTGHKSPQMVPTTCNHDLTVGAQHPCGSFSRILMINRWNAARSGLFSRRRSRLILQPMNHN